MSFRVDLSTFRGPLDLLLYLVRKHEIDVADLPIAAVTQQYLEYLAVLEQLDVDAVGDFLEMASTLIEIKSRMVLPRGGEEIEEFDDPRQQLVERLLEYKRYKDAASMLEDRGRESQKRYARQADDLPPRRIDPADQPIREAELWDLVSAFGRVMREHEAVRPSNIVYDETPIQVYMERLRGQLVSRGKLTLSEAFETGMHKSAMIGMFLAILELVRHHCVYAEQEDLHSDLWIVPGENFDQALDSQSIDNYDASGDDAADDASPAPQ